MENRLVVSFTDQNGAITLGRYETDFNTGVMASQTVTVTADQFNTAPWDDDNDGIANLDELIAGSNPLVNNGTELVSPEPVRANLELVQDKTFRLSWRASSAAHYYRLLEDADSVSGFTQVGEDINGALLQFDHRVALYKRTNAKYVVQACNAHSCVDSQEIPVPDSLSEAVGYFKAMTDNPNNFDREVAISADGNAFAVAGTQLLTYCNCMLAVVALPEASAARAKSLNWFTSCCGSAGVIRDAVHLRYLLPIA